MYTICVCDDDNNEQDKEENCEKSELDLPLLSIGALGGLDLRPELLHLLQIHLLARVEARYLHAVAVHVPQLPDLQSETLGLPFLASFQTLVVGTTLLDLPLQCRHLPFPLRGPADRAVHARPALCRSRALPVPQIEFLHVHHGLRLNEAGHLPELAGELQSLERLVFLRRFHFGIGASLNSASDLPTVFCSWFNSLSMDLTCDCFLFT